MIFATCQPNCTSKRSHFQVWTVSGVCSGAGDGPYLAERPSFFPFINYFLLGISVFRLSPLTFRRFRTISAVLGGGNLQEEEKKGENGKEMEERGEIRGNLWRDKGKFVER